MRINNPNKIIIVSIQKLKITQFLSSQFSDLNNNKYYISFVLRTNSSFQILKIEKKRRSERTITNVASTNVVS